MSVCSKVRPDGSVFDPAETNPQGSRQDIAQKEFVTEAYCDVTRGVHGPQLSATKSNLMGQCLTQPKLTLKEAGRFFLREKLSQRPNLILQGTWPRTFSHKVKPDGSVFDTAETNPQGSRQDIAQKEFVTEAYCDVTRGVMAHKYLPQCQILWVSVRHSQN